MPTTPAGFKATAATPDVVLEALNNPLTPTYPLLASLADLLGLPSLPNLDALPQPTLRPKKSTASKSTCPPISDSDRSKLAMRIVNSSLTTLSSLVQAKWSPSPPPISKSTVGRSSKKEPPSDAPRVAVRSEEQGRASATASSENVRTIVGCAQLALRSLRMRPGKEEEPDVTVEKAGVTVVARANALGLYDLALALLQDSHPSILRLNGQSPLKPLSHSPEEAAVPKSSKATSTTRTVRLKAPVTASTTPSASASRTPTVRAKAAKPATSTSQALPSTSPQSISHPVPESDHLSLFSQFRLPPQPNKPISDPALAFVFLTWALSATLAVFMSTHVTSSPSALHSSSSTLLSSLESPSSPFQTVPSAMLSVIPTSTHPALLLPLIRALFSPPNLSSSSLDPVPALLLRYRLLSISLLVHLPDLQPPMLWDQVLRAITSYLRVAGPGGRLEKEDYNRVSSGLRRVVEEVGRRKGGEQMMRGKEWVKVTELWGKVAGKIDDVSTLTLISQLLNPADPIRTSTTLSTNDLISKLGNLTLASLTPSPSPPLSEPTPPVDPSLILAQTSALFSQILALSTSHASSPSSSSAAILTSQLQHAQSSIDQLKGMAGRISGEDDEEEMLGKMSRGMEKLRRGCLVIVEAKGGVDGNAKQGEEATSRETEKSLRGLAEGTLWLLVEVVEGLISFQPGQHRRTTSSLPNVIDLVTSSVDSLLLLSRSHLSPNRSSTYALSFELLARTDSLQSALRAILFPSAPSSDSGSTPSFRRDIANLLRCISGTAYNSGGTIYRTGREADGPGGEAVVKFFRMACELGREAVREHETAGVTQDEQDSEKDKDVWDGLKSGMSKRWELLGGCLLKKGEKQQGYEAFLTALSSTSPLILSQITTISSSTPLSDFLSLPSDSPEVNTPPNAAAFSSLASLISRFTNVALTLPPSPADDLSKSLRAINRVGKEEDRSAATGALLEFQLGILERLRGKEGVSEMVDRVLRETLACYRADKHPVRRLRVIACQIQHMAYSFREDDVQQTSAEELVSEAVQLGETKTFALDAELAPYIRQYLGSCHLWFAIHAYISSQQQLPPSPSSETTVIAQQPNHFLHHSDRAAKIIGELVPESGHVDGLLSSQLKEKATKASLDAATVKTPAPVVERTRRTPARSVKAIVAVPAVPPKSRTTKTPKSTVKATPRAKKVVEVEHATPPPTMKSRLARHDVVFDDLNSLLSLLETMSNLLGLLGHVLQRLDYLRLIRKLSHDRPAHADMHVRASGYLATEYLKMSKITLARSVFSSTSNRLQQLITDGRSISLATRVDFSLRHAQFLVKQGRMEAALVSYQEALKMSKEVIDVGTSSSSARIREKCTRLERAAFAFMVAADIHKAKNDSASVFSSLAQSHRLWTRAADNISRLSQPAHRAAISSKGPSLANPFSVAKSADPDPATQPSADQAATKAIKTPSFFGKKLNGTQWRVSEGYLYCLFEIASATHNRGTSRDTEYYLQQACELAQSVGSNVFVARSLGRKATLFMQTGRLNEAVGITDEALESLGDVVGCDTAELATIRGQQYLKFGNFDEAYNTLAAGTQSLRAIDAACSTQTQSLRLSISNRRRSSSSGGFDHAYLPLLAFLLRLQAATIKHVEDHDPAILQALQEEIARLPSTPETLSLIHHHDAKLGLIRVLEEFESDLSLSSLTESTISMPMGSATGGSAAVSKSRAAVRLLLVRVEAAFNKSLETNEVFGAVQKVREASVSLNRIRSFATSLGFNDASLTLNAARLLDASSAITLRRELMETIEAKFPEAARDDLEWHDFEPSQFTPPVRRMSVYSGSDEGDVEEVDLSEDPTRAYWRTLQEQHSLPSSLVASPVPSLPHNWSVITINVTEDLNTLYVSRHRHNSEPLVFCLPLERQTRRDADLEGQLTFAEAISELADIIAKSNLGAKNAKDVEGKEGKLAWWAERRELDKRMEDLLNNIEFCWLGAFKTILNVPSTATLASLPSFRTKVEKLFKNALSTTQERRKLPRVRLDDSLIECFATLSSKCRDEELEDLVYFVLDLYQVHGFPVALAELDIDQLATDLRDILIDLDSPRLSPPSKPADVDEPHHTFLILDRHVQPIPWESLPTLRGRSICRIPSLAFLTDRILLSRLHQPSTMHPPSLPSTSLEEASPSPPEEIASSAMLKLDGKNGFYVLNPSGDLKKTQERFEPWVERMEKAGWTGISGRAPSEVELLKALESKDVVVYFGHGGAEQYIRSHRIRNLSRCASLMLWGCSSGILREMGELDRSGTPWNYMLAGCPSLVANLWDVTDRDIDRLSEAVLESMHLNGSETTDKVARNRRKRSTAEAVGDARSKCKLKYLTGAAPVVYGVPVGLLEESMS